MSYIDDLINSYNKLPEIEQLNLFRNLYYTDGNCTEKGIIANALNEILPQFVQYREQLEKLTQASKDSASAFYKMEGLYNIKCMELKVAKSEAVKEFANQVVRVIRPLCYNNDQFYLISEALYDLLKERIVTHNE